jgi:hypothetical protein
MKQPHVVKHSAFAACITKSIHPSSGIPHAQAYILQNPITKFSKLEFPVFAQIAAMIQSDDLS